MQRTIKRGTGPEGKSQVRPEDTMRTAALGWIIVFYTFGSFSLPTLPLELSLSTL